ncbi:unnamed protein product, partial [Oppiella nova]
MSRHLVFFYGTLKKGQPNHHFMADDMKNGRCEYVCSGQTVDKWPMVIATRYNIPCLLFKKGQGKQIYGEIYSMDTTLLNWLDFKESQVLIYKRVEIPVQLPDESIKIIWVYFIMNFKPQLLDLDNFSEYDSYGKHGLAFVGDYDPERDNYDPMSDIL